MTTIFAPYGEYEEIIDLLGEWKILDMKSLAEMISYELSYRKLMKRVRKLENVGLIKSVLVGRKNKHIYLTEKGIQFTPYDFTSEIKPEQLTHDLLVSRVLMTLLERPNFMAGKMFHQIEGNDIYPDAEVVGTRNRNSYKLAIEVEITQKSQDRVKQKYVKYGKADFFDFAIFITNRERLYQTYKLFLESMTPKIQRRIVIAYDKKLKVTKANLDKTKCFYLGNEVNFGDIFGENEGNLSGTKGTQTAPPP